MRRTVTPPSGTDPGEVTAAYRNGVPGLHVPKSEHAQVRRIPIQGQQALPTAPAFFRPNRFIP